MAKCITAVRWYVVLPSKLRRKSFWTYSYQFAKRKRLCQYSLLFHSWANV